MLAQQSFAQTRDRAPDTRVAVRLDRKIAFGIDVERPVSEQKFKCPCHGSGFYITGINFEGPAPRPLERWAISIGDDGQLVVDDRELAVHVQARHIVIEPRQDRRVEAIAAVAVGFTKHPVIARAQHAHRRVLEPAALHVRRENGDVGRVGPAQPRGESLRDRARRGILVLGKNVAARRRNGVEAAQSPPPTIPTSWNGGYGSPR